MTSFNMGKHQGGYVLCPNCGCFVKQTKSFTKTWDRSALCLCKKCALGLAKEIEERYEVDLHE